jgi:hypothetical protein
VSKGPEAGLSFFNAFSSKGVLLRIDIKIAEIGFFG